MELQHEKAKRLFFLTVILACGLDSIGAYCSRETLGSGVPIFVLVICGEYVFTVEWFARIIRVLIAVAGVVYTIVSLLALGALIGIPSFTSLPGLLALHGASGVLYLISAWHYSRYRLSPRAESIEVS